MEISKKYRSIENPIPSTWMPAAEMKKFTMCYVEYEHDILNRLDDIDQRNIPYHLRKTRDELYDENYQTPYRVLVYFTDNPKLTWGDDWNDAYHSSGEPYTENDHRTLIAELIFPWYMREILVCLPEKYEDRNSAEDFMNGMISYFFLDSGICSGEAQKKFMRKHKLSKKPDMSDYECCKSYIEDLPRVINSSMTLNEVKRTVKLWGGRFGFIREYDDQFIQDYSAFYQDRDEEPQVDYGEYY